MSRPTDGFSATMSLIWRSIRTEGRIARVSSNIVALCGNHGRMSACYGPSAMTDALGALRLRSSGHLLCVAALLDVHLLGRCGGVPPVFDHGNAHRLSPGQVPKLGEVGFSYPYDPIPIIAQQLLPPEPTVVPNA